MVIIKLLLSIQSSLKTKSNGQKHPLPNVLPMSEDANEYMATIANIDTAIIAQYGFDCINIANFSLQSKCR